MSSCHGETEGEAMSSCHGEMEGEERKERRPVVSGRRA